jgi:mannose-6-phosphate isomerase-like protein (cupin superfamily)
VAEGVVAEGVGVSIMSDRKQSDDELVAYAAGKLSTSKKVSFWDTYDEPEIPQQLAANGVVSDYNTGQMVDGGVSARAKAPGFPEALLAGIDWSEMPQTNWRFQPLLNQTDDNGWSVTCYIVPPESERRPHSVPRHYHEEDQVFVVLEGEVRQGNRRFGPGSGMFVPAGSTYGVQYGPEGARYLEIRHGKPSERRFTFVDEDANTWRETMFPSASSAAGGASVSTED